MRQFIEIIIVVVLSIYIAGILPSCRKKASAPTLTTADISIITHTSAVSGGNITDDGGAEVTERGVCWDISQSPTAGSSKTADGKGIGIFTSIINNLIANTTYHVRAYATNSEGTSYGNEVLFTTIPLPLFPTITTEDVTSITPISVISGGNVTNTGGELLTYSGVCWSTAQNPTIEDNHTSDGSYDTGRYTSYVNGLIPSTTYYIRAYASNSAGTAYGNQLNITTHSEFDPILFHPNLTYGAVSDIEENVYKTIQIGTQVWMAENLKTTKFNDGTSIPFVPDDQMWASLMTPGYCWYNNDEGTYKTPFGALYNWFTIKTDMLCPVGWHIPNDQEWQTLCNYLGNNVGGKLMETGTAHWLFLNPAGTNESGFTAIPGGVREVDYGSDYFLEAFTYIGKTAGWWSRSANLQLLGNSVGINNDGSFFYNSPPTGGGGYGLSVRCLKD